MKLLTSLILLLLLLCVATPAAAQVPGPAQQAQLQQYLADRDISETELRQRLLEKGIDVDTQDPAKLLALKPQIDATIAEMVNEKEAAERAAKENAAESALDIEKAVDDGASVEEAIAEVTQEAAGESLAESNIYGHQIFRNKSLRVYRASENATPPNSYPLQPGDEIAITIFGASQSDFILRLDDQGFVKLPNGLRMPLAGIPLGEARLLLANRLRQFYTFREGQLNIRIQAARTISVNIFGEVESNGSFTMSSLNTGFNALVAAGGPTEVGTVRNIQLIQGEKKTMLDVYAYLQSPTEGTALFLNDNSRIFVPRAEKIITLEGGVQRPLLYELKAGETLTDLLAFAGGVKPRAETENIRVTRYVDGALEVINVNLEEQPDFVPANEDIIVVPTIVDPIENFVSVEGAVQLPGRYAYREGLTLGELLDLGRLRPGARRDAAFLFRDNDDGTSRLIRVDLGGDAGAKEVELRRGDRLRVLTSSAFLDRATFTVTGAVRDTSVTLPFPQDGALTLEEAVLLAGGTETNAAPDAMLVRTDMTNRADLTYRRVDLATEGDLALQPLDRIIVYTQERYTDRRTVSITGAVRQRGAFVFGPSLTLEDLLYMAGGTSIDADRSRVEVFRLQFVDGAETKTLFTNIDVDNAGDFVLQPFDEVVVRSTAEFEEIQNIFIVGEVRYPGPYALLKDNERLSDVIDRAGGLTAEAFPEGATLYRREGEIGYVVLDLDQAVTDQLHPANMVVLEGDTLFVPKKNELVTIYTQNTLANRFGVDSITVNGSIQVAYQGKKSARWYVNNYAGGFDDDSARKRWTTVEYASGRVKETNSFLGVHDYPEVKPGASIRIATAPPKKQKQRREERFDWIGLASVILGAASSLTTLWLLSRRD